jgi:hypothetical protein
MKGQLGEMHMTLQITRAATGKTETVQLVGRVVADTEETEHGSNTQRDSTERSDGRSGGPA